MAEKILIVDDEAGMVNFIKDALMGEGYWVFTANNGEEAIALAAKQPDLIILDVMMPEKDGFEVCQAIRDTVACPILFLSALGGENDKVKGLALGGDDYIVKPFSLRELKMRVSAHLRRERRAGSVETKAYLRFGNLAIHIKGRQILFKDQELFFTRREFDIIELLALHPGQVFSKDQIYEKIWGYDAEGDSACIAEHIKKLRAKLSEADAHNEYISTVWGVGYKWERVR